jgi:Family of unknown function (DUF5906)
VSAFEALADEPRWVAWRLEPRGNKLTKVPYGTGGRRAKADDPATWVVRSEATALAARIANGHGGGIGYELGDLGNDLYLAGVDVDSCIDEKGCLALWAERILAELPTYAETSPSGSGVKSFFYCASEDVRPFLEAIGIVDPRQWGTRRSIGEDGRDHGPAVEIYFARRFFAVTEQPFPGKPDRIALLDWPQLERLARPVPNVRTDKSGGGDTAGRDNSRSAKAFREGARLRREGKGFEEMVEALRTHPDPDIRSWVREKGDIYGQRELHRIWDKGAPAPSQSSQTGVSLEDFHAYMPMHAYIFVPSRQLWPAGSVNARVPPVQLRDAAGNPVFDQEGKPARQKASAWLDKNKPVEQMTWAPGLPMLIKDLLTSEGGWLVREGVSCFNLYRPPLLVPGDKAKASPWIDHLNRVYPDDAEHILCWLAHRVQFPEDKINHALVLGGSQGIGKDTLLEPVKRAIGPWNWQDVTPRDLIGRFNGFAKAVILRVNEARDLGDINRFQFYDHMKLYTAAPPDVLRVDEKNLREYYVTNCCGVIITTNHKADGIYLPIDDRRHYVAWSALAKESFKQSYWDELWGWYNSGGDRDVAACLAQLDISSFNPKSPPPKTAAFWEIVNSNRSPDDAELADLLDLLSNPKAVTLPMLLARASEDVSHWLSDRKNRRMLPHRFEACGYTPVRNDGANDGLWKIGIRRQVIYAKADLSLRERLEAARDLVERRSV